MRYHKSYSHKAPKVDSMGGSGFAIAFFESSYDSDMHAASESLKDRIERAMPLPAVRSLDGWKGVWAVIGGGRDEQFPCCDSLHESEKKANVCCLKPVREMRTQLRAERKARR